MKPGNHLSSLPGDDLARRIGGSRRGQAVVAAVGAWLVTGTVTFGHGSGSLRASDLIAGIALLLLAAATAVSGKARFAYAEAVVGAWLLVAPLVFWAPTALEYANPTAAGVIVIAAAIAAPMSRPETGPPTPPGWSYNPSSWSQRLPIVVLGAIGFFVSRYLAAYQLGHIDEVWDPLFGDGTARVLDSEVSRWFPVSDAGLGAVVYLVDSLSAIGSEQRYRTTPWMVAILAVAAVPLGMSSVVLLILQPTVVGAFCFLCIVQAAITLGIVALALDEIVATAQFLVRKKREGHGLLRTFFYGGDLPETYDYGREPSRTDRLRAMTRGTTPPWNLWCTAALGLASMFAPDLLGIEGGGARNLQTCGALVLLFSVVAFAEVARPIRLLNVAVGLWLAASGFFFSGGPGVAAWGAFVSGLAIMALSLRRGPVREEYGTYVYASLPSLRGR